MGYYVLILKKDAGHVTKCSDLIGLVLFLAGKLLYFEQGKMDAFFGSTVVFMKKTIWRIYKIC